MENFPEMGQMFHVERSWLGDTAGGVGRVGLGRLGSTWNKPTLPPGFPGPVFTAAVAEKMTRPSPPVCHTSIFDFKGVTGGLIPFAIRYSYLHTLPLGAPIFPGRKDANAAGDCSDADKIAPVERL